MEFISLSFNCLKIKHLVKASDLCTLHREQTREQEKYLHRTIPSQVKEELLAGDAQNPPAIREVLASYFYWTKVRRENSPVLPHLPT